MRAGRRGVTVEIDKPSLAATLSNFRQMGREIDPDISRIILSAGVDVQREAKQMLRQIPLIRYGMLRSSIYVDWKGRIAKNVNVRPDAPPRVRQLLVFPASETDRDGLNVTNGTELVYGAIWNERKGFIDKPHEKHSDIAERKINDAINKITR